MLDSIYTPCDEWSEKLSMPIDDLSPADRAALEAHVAECPACSLAQTDFSMVGRLLRSLPAPEFPSELPPALLQLWEEENASVQAFASRDADALADFLPQLQILTSQQDDTIVDVSGEMHELSELLPLETTRQEIVTSSTKCVIHEKDQPFSSDILPLEVCVTREEERGSNSQMVDLQTPGELILVFMLEEHSRKDLGDAIEQLALGWTKEMCIRILNWLKLSHFSSRKTLRCNECGCYFPFRIDEQKFYSTKYFIHPPTRCPTCRMVYHAIQVAFTSTGYVTSVFQGKELKEPYKVQCEKCGKLVSLPFFCEKGTSVYCNNCSCIEKTLREVDCETKELKVNMKEMHRSGIPMGGTGITMLCLNVPFRHGEIFNGECIKNIAQIIETVQHLNAQNQQEDNHRKEFKYSQNKHFS